MVRRLEGVRLYHPGQRLAGRAAARHVQKNVGQAIVGNDESKSLGYIEPLNGTAQLDDARRLVGEIAHRLPIGSDAGAGPS